MTEKSFHEAGHAVAASVLGTPIKLAHHGWRHHRVVDRQRPGSTA